MREESVLGPLKSLELLNKTLMNLVLACQVKKNSPSVSSLG